ncbi:MAG: TIGR04086 family membrane protein [Christensenellaceae bacterium]
MQSENSFAAHLVQIAKAVLLSVLFCLAAVLIFSLVLKFASLSESVIKPVNQCIKALAILFGCFFALRGEKGWLKGLAAGILTVMLTYLVFAMVGGDFSLSWLILAELAFGAVAGALSGIVAVNVHHD